ncbi:MAG: hypothetical protein AAFW66_01660, partial [Pseudomonadota bacterium]
SAKQSFRKVTLGLCSAARFFDLVIGISPFPMRIFFGMFVGKSNWDGPYSVHPSLFLLRSLMKNGWI